MIRPRAIMTGDGGLGGLGALVDKAVAKAVYEHGQDVLSEADGLLQGPGPLVPVDTGALRNSGYVSPPRMEGAMVVSEVGYGGVAAPYAVTVHEKVEDGINWSRPGSGPKFLENAVKHMSPLFPRRVVYELAAALRNFRGR